MWEKDRPDRVGMIKWFVEDSGYKKSQILKCLANKRLGYQKYPVSHDCKVLVDVLEEKYWREFQRKSNGDPPDMEYKSLYGPGVPPAALIDRYVDQLLEMFSPDPVDE